jgi:hypothetical protein
MTSPPRFDLDVVKGSIFGPVMFTAVDATGNPINLTNWQVFAKSTNGFGQLYDLQPFVSNPAAGQITIQLTQQQTDLFSIGRNRWDFMLQRPTGERLPPFLGGNLTVTEPVSNV